MSSRTSALFLVEAESHASLIEWNIRSGKSKWPPWSRKKKSVNGSERTRNDETEKESLTPVGKVTN